MADAAWARANWELLKDLFDAAMDRPREDRGRFLAESCAGDAVLLRELESLVAFSEREPGILDTSPVSRGAGGPSGRARDPLPGHRIGPYEILGEIGHGGMGSVHLARRADDQFRMKVAIKLVRPGMDTASLLRRFQKERQILASLDHPNIAHLLDGGVTGEGLPYLVMEYVEGRSFLEYCDGRRLPVKDRLRLFRLVCGAVQYAHQNLVVHRDIKPANILVTPGEVPKLLDFGIARLLGPEPSSPSMDYTASFLRLMTPDTRAPSRFAEIPSPRRATSTRSVSCSTSC